MNYLCCKGNYSLHGEVLGNLRIIHWYSSRKLTLQPCKNEYHFVTSLKYINTVPAIPGKLKMWRRANLQTPHSAKPAIPGIRYIDVGEG